MGEVLVSVSVVFTGRQSSSGVTGKREASLELGSPTGYA